MLSNDAYSIQVSRSWLRGPAKRIDADPNNGRWRVRNPLVRQCTTPERLVTMDQVNLTGLFIRRPVMTTLIMLGIVLFGVIAYRALPVSDLPNIDFPPLQVNAALPGANPETMAAAVATPLERQFSTIAGLDNMTSSSALGGTAITLQFALGRSLDGAALDVQAAIQAAGSQLPPGMPTPPMFQKVNPADQPILYVSLYSSTLPLSTVDEYAETVIGQRVSTVSGVAQVSVQGAQKYAVRVQLDPNALASRKIGIDDVQAALA